MLTACIHEDCFFLAALPAATAKELCPLPLTPVVTGASGWMSVVAVRLTRVRFFGWPVAAQAVCAASLLLAEYRDSSGTLQRGNYFLKGFATSRAFCVVTRCLGADIFHHKPLLLKLEEHSMNVEVPGMFSARIIRDGKLSVERQQLQVECLFENNRQGFVRARNSIWRLALEKTHWNIRGCEADIYDAGLFDEVGAQFRFAFDTSNAIALWHAPRRVQSNLPKADDLPNSCPFPA